RAFEECVQPHMMRQHTMKRTGYILAVLASASLLAIATVPEQLWAQTREHTTTEETVTKTTTTTTTSPVTLTREIVGQHAPPPPRQEVIVTPPAGKVWVSGTWTRDNNTWVWVSGRLEQPPEQKMAWVPGEWMTQGPNWVWHPGHWE